MPNTDDSTHDETMPQGRWTFDQDVTEVFDDMLIRSIPQYEVMRQAVTDLVHQYIQPKTAVIDLGSSRGEAVAPLIDHYALRNRFILCEVSQPMLDVLMKRFEVYIGMGSVAVRNLDLRTEFPTTESSIVLSILTLQFIPIEYRQQIIAAVYHTLNPGGAFILVEKVLGETHAINQMMVNLYYALKAENGYTQDQIERKRLALEGVLVPVTASWNMELLQQAGFRQVDCFWRWMNFAGWIAIK